MKNPWEEISLSDYENHMKLDSVKQLQAMNEMMKGQFDAYPISSMMILGVAGGNGLEHVQKDKFDKVYGVDISAAYLQEVRQRYSELDGILECLCIDSPYLHVFDGLDCVHHQMEEQALECAMLEINYHKIKTLEYELPNGKKLVQMDFER